MAVREIKTTIALDGEQKFKQAIAAINQSMRVSESEMKRVSAAYELSGDKATLLAERQRILGDEIDQQKEKISQLESMLKKASAAYDKAGQDLAEYKRQLAEAEKSGNGQEIKRLTDVVNQAETAYNNAAKKVRDYTIQLNNAEAKEKTLKKTSQEVDREVEELGRDSIKAGRQLEQGIGEGAENAEKDVKSLIETMQEDISSIRTSTAFSAVSSLWDMASGAYSSVAGFVDGTAELRRKMSFLEQNAKTQGFDFAVLKEQLSEINTLTGDTSSSIEGLSNLLAIGLDADQMTRAVDLLAGAVISFPDTIKFESLADSLQETLATGEATGQFSELLGRLGVDVETFNNALDESKTASGDLDIALAYLAEGGLKDVYDQWQDNNQAMVEAGQTQSELEQEMAEFGGTLEEYIVTPVKSLLVDALKWVNDELAILDEWKADRTGKSREVDPFGLSTTTYYEDPYAGHYVIKPVTYDEPIGPPTAEQYEAAGAEAANAYINGFESEIVLLEEEAKQAQGFVDMTGIPTEGDLRKLLEGLNEELEKSEDELEEAGEEAGDAMTGGFATAWKALDNKAYLAGASMAKSYAEGVNSQLGMISAAASRLSAAASSALATARAGASRAIVLNLDGRKVAEGIVPYTDEAMATYVSTD